jgi:hypothetical protein
MEEVLGMIEGIPRGKRPQYLEANAMRFRARLAAGRGEVDSVENLLKGGVGLFREVAAPFHMAVTLLEQGGWLVSQQRAPQAGPLLDEAGGVFERLKAHPWLDRLQRARGTVAQVL